MEASLEEMKKHIERNRMSLPQMCQQCPYRKILQQLLGLWDNNLMKQAGINQYEEKVKSLQEQLQVAQLKLQNHQSKKE